jgi:hypothetical protein
MTVTVTASVPCNPTNCPEAYTYVIDALEYIEPLFTYLELL